ncbi:hypothetical protein KY285_000862 [Solanum tuberosum]|nr:hypothetical protein KY285_000862 [Solanum tuberosum]
MEEKILRMDRVCIYIAYNGKWTTDNKYLDHEIKLILVNDGITFEGLAEKIFQVLKLKVGEIKANIWFDSNLETSKGMQVTNDEEVTTCIYLLKMIQISRLPVSLLILRKKILCPQSILYNKRKCRLKVMRYRYQLSQYQSLNLWKQNHLMV